MDERVALSGSGGSSSSSPRRAPLRSLLVPVVGSALGPLGPSGPSVPAAGDAPWRTKRGRRERARPARPRAPFRPLGRRRTRGCRRASSAVATTAGRMTTSCGSARTRPSAFAAMAPGTAPGTARCGVAPRPVAAPPGRMLVGSVSPLRFRPCLGRRWAGKVEEPSCCYLERSEEMERLEAELARAVVVSIVGNRPAVDLASAAKALHAAFDVGPASMSIRAFFPEDFLVLCDSIHLRQRMADRGRADDPGFSLSLRPWIRQAQATAVNLPFLVPLDLIGVPANAWTRRTADVILDGYGYVVDVAEETSSRNDMSHFRVWLRTADICRIPSRKLLFVEEPALPPAPAARSRPRVFSRARAGTLRSHRNPSGGRPPGGASPTAASLFATAASATFPAV
ncbi:uncharacterized protein [Aegilops tauschii subsp. strangulata]|uniref:uncharacterized protein n=1 Tax=Aegilops tauschii subsp. strangulata TaxID=200361 RepID=UPI001E1CA14A|nr:uncharacterized protein LOC109731635 [Aegilops tauschii subsp. strangulata]